MEKRLAARNINKSYVQSSSPKVGFLGRLNVNITTLRMLQRASQGDFLKLTTSSLLFKTRKYMCIICFRDNYSSLKAER